MRTEGKDESLIARTIMPLAQHLGLDVVAEGVETVEQALLLRELQCKYAQGFLFSRPLAAEDVQKLLAKAAVPAAAGVPSDAQGALQAAAPGVSPDDPDEEFASANVKTSTLRIKGFQKLR
jgi:predicted signal transduction protein with EAL and GGDEF domain